MFKAPQRRKIDKSWSNICFRVEERRANTHDDQKCRSKNLGQTTRLAKKPEEVKKKQNLDVYFLYDFFSVGKITELPKNDCLQFRVCVKCCPAIWKSMRVSKTIEKIWPIFRNIIFWWSQVTFVDCNLFMIIVKRKKRTWYFD